MRFISRIAEATGVETRASIVPEDEADATAGHTDATLAADPSVVVYRITGAIFFGAASTVENAARHHVKVFITGASTAVRQSLNAHAVKDNVAAFRPDIADAVREAHALAS